jgi:60 kDa SS-A/Ro ribonucleoprotein
MKQKMISDNVPLTPREAAAALSLVQMRSEEDYEIIGFTGEGQTFRNQGSGIYSQNYRRDPGVARLSLSPRQRLDNVCEDIERMVFGPTDCAQPMLWALKQRRHIDTFVIYTDNETWHGAVHPHQALRRYREQMNPDARLIVVSMTPPARQTIADPADPLTLDVSGFDAAVPSLIADFSRGAVG